MFPENDECCAWNKAKTMYNFNLFKYEDLYNGESRRICNVDLTNGTKASNETCCQEMANKAHDCGEIYYGAGPAFEDIM